MVNKSIFQTKITRAMVSKREIPIDLEADVLNRTIRKNASNRGTAAIKAQVVLYILNNLPSEITSKQKYDMQY